MSTILGPKIIYIIREKCVLLHIYFEKSVIILICGESCPLEKVIICNIIYKVRIFCGAYGFVFYTCVFIYDRQPDRLGH